ncbi:MAG: shikimate dehydrogenase [Janthinobacterium lividum]
MTNISGTTKIVGVWGHPVGHSRSPAMHNAALKALGLDWVYVPFDVAPESVGAAVAGIRALGLVGVNVTVPLKELVLPYLDVVDDAAAQIGSVNTICNRDGRLSGYSTDGAGFLQSLGEVGQSTQGRQALVLGAGGSARAVAFALASQGNFCWITNRTSVRAEALAADVNRVYPGRAEAVGWGAETGPFDLLVNTTSLGMHPKPDERPMLPPGAFAGKPFVYDLIYVPARTRLMEQAEASGCQTMNGIKMLAHQGAISLALWTGLPLSEIPVSVMEQAILASL